MSDSTNRFDEMNGPEIMEEVKRVVTPKLIGWYVVRGAVRLGVTKLIASAMSKIVEPEGFVEYVSCLAGAAALSGVICEHTDDYVYKQYKKLTNWEPIVAVPVEPDIPNVTTL